MTRLKVGSPLEAALLKKARSLRSSWLGRAAKLNRKEEVPDVQSIYEYLCSFSDNNRNVLDYISNSYISVKVMEVDHKIPVSRGGSFFLENVGVTSRYYNNIKGELTSFEFQELLSLVSNWEDKGKNLFTRLMRSNKIYGKR